MSLLPSSSFRVTNRTLQKTSLPGDDYVLSLTQIANSYVASASSPSNQIHLFDKATLQSTGTFRGHEHATTYLRTVSGLGNSTREMLLSSGKDGCVIAWDERSGSASIKMVTSGRPRPLLCCDASTDGLLVVAGTDLQKDDAFIMDPRNPVARLRSHGSTHSDDITAVHFLKAVDAPSANNLLLLSTSSDGLVCTSDALEVDEDEAVLHVGNWGCSISQGGWISDARRTRIWAASDMETFSCWSNELDQLSAVDIRSSSLHDHGKTWVTDYLINGHATQEADNGFAMFVGSNEGDVALIMNNDLSDAGAPWTIHSVWVGGHSGVVRSLYWDEKQNVLVTGGEDSKVVTWQQDPDATGFVMHGQLDDLMESDVSTLKREWDDMIGDNQAISDAKRVRW